VTSTTPETLPAIVNRMARGDPDRVFLQSTDGPSATWAQLQSSMVEWAARFLALGVEPGDVVVTILDSGVEALSAWLGLSGIGAIDAATNPEFRGRMLAYAINNCEPELLVVAPKYLRVVEGVAAELKTVKRVLVLDGPRMGGSRGRRCLVWSDPVSCGRTPSPRERVSACRSSTTSPVSPTHPAPPGRPRR
jgi:crotonobetaine/carnitine-CoA ligase